MPGTNFIIGTSKSGISLLTAILECSRNTKIKRLQESFLKIYNYLDDPSRCKEQLDLTMQEIDSHTECIIPLYIDYSFYLEKRITILDWLNVLKWATNSRAVWMVRDPIINTVVCHKAFNIDINDLVYYWEDVNTYLWYWFHTLDKSDRCMIKFEELLVNPIKCKRAFDTFMVPFDKQFIRYGDFDHDFCSCSNSVKMGQIDVENIDPYEHPDVLPKSRSGIRVQLGYT